MRIIKTKIIREVQKQKSRFLEMDLDYLQTDKYQMIFSMVILLMKMEKLRLNCNVGLSII